MRICEANSHAANRGMQPGEISKADFAANCAKRNLQRYRALVPAGIRERQKGSSTRGTQPGARVAPNDFTRLRQVDCAHLAECPPATPEHAAVL